MTWLLWRQHRAQALVAGLALALFAVAVVITGVHMARIYDDAIRACPEQRHLRRSSGTSSRATGPSSTSST